ncbi:MAG: HAD family hydrolase [Kiritimatiellae bacterium]|nr:HAD family hydrolase [Kiritimatiellia bacterium]
MDAISPLSADGPRDYVNNIFDLYGTLVDVRTDENKPAVWRFMADWYAVHGCRLSPDAIRDAFWQMETREREAFHRQTNLEHPEIRIERVFLRLLFDSPSLPCPTPLDNRPIDEWRTLYARDSESVLQALVEGPWVFATANAFRILSRDWLCPYPDTIPVLRELRRRGKRLFLLSNAQAVFTRPEIAQTGLAEFFPIPCLSSEFGMMKPQREFLAALLQRDNLLPRDTVFVGNEMRSDMAIALRCGIDAVYLNTAHRPSEDLQEESNRLLAHEDVPHSAVPRIFLSNCLGDLLPGPSA